MYQVTVRCKSLRLAERIKGGEMGVTGSAEKPDIQEYTEASLEGSGNGSHFFFSFPVELLDSDIKIGDEILVTFERKNK